MKKASFIGILIFLFVQAIAQTGDGLIDSPTLEQLQKSMLISDTIIQKGFSTGKVMACAGNAPNDLFVNAQALVVNGGFVAGTTCGTQSAFETPGCNSGLTNTTVWYKFVATASTQYVQVVLTSGSCYVGSAVYPASASWPTSKCGKTGPISCQSAAGGPVTQLHQLTNLTVGATYYIQITYGAGGGCGTNATFNIQVTSANPGGYITNPPPLTNCASPGAGCFFASPPAVATVTAGCTSYPLAAAGYSANAVWGTVIQFTSSASWSNFSWQAIITSNCSGGNVHWLNWTLYDCSCNELACGDLSTLTGNGLACGTCYRLKYELELANCSTVPLNINPPNFTTIWPYQNVPSSPLPCTVLPMKLLYFTASPNSDTKKVNVEWESASEDNLKEYRVYRSDDGINFNSLTTVKAKNDKGQKYNYEDACCNSQETRYYKLNAIDENGTVSFEKIIAVTVNAGKELIKFAPNPAQDNFIIIFGESARNSDTQVSIMNSLGQIVKVENFISDKYSRQINIEELPEGIYFVNVITQNSQEVIKYKLVKQ